MIKQLLPTHAFAIAWLTEIASAANHLSAFVPADITLFGISSYLQLRFSIKHLSRLTVRYFHAIANGLTLGGILVSTIAA